MSVRSSISVSFWLRMPGHGGAGSWSRTGRFCVPWAGRTRAVAPCLLCEDLAVILVLWGWVWRLRSPLRGYCFGTLVPWFLAPFYRVCGGGLVRGCPGLLAWTDHCFSLGARFLDLASSSVACHPSPSHGLARLVGLCMSPLFEMVSVLFHGNMGSHFWGISRSFLGSV